MKTKRNQVMFRAGGHSYVYVIYGMYHCVNVVSDPEGEGSGVVLRAVEPLEGLEVSNGEVAACRCEIWQEVLGACVKRLVSRHRFAAIILRSRRVSG